MKDQDKEQAWNNFRLWFDSIDEQVKGKTLRAENTHLWITMLGIRNVMCEIAIAELGVNWVHENNVKNAPSNSAAFAEMGW
jgi:hypothetical protein